LFAGPISAATDIANGARRGIMESAGTPGAGSCERAEPLPNGRDGVGRIGNPSHLKKRRTPRRAVSKRSAYLADRHQTVCAGLGWRWLPLLLPQLCRKWTSRLGRGG